MNFVYHLSLLSLICIGTVWSTDGPWAWRCDESNPDVAVCKKETKDLSDPDQLSFLRCKLICGTFGAIWPQPVLSSLGKNVDLFLPENVQITVQAHVEVFDLTYDAATLAVQHLNMYNPNYNGDDFVWPTIGNSTIDGHIVVLNVIVEDITDKLLLGTDESYSVAVSSSDSSTTSLTITAKTFFGARHGLETFTQLVEFDEDSGALQIINNVFINDQPTYTYRGLIIDSSRNFIPVPHLKLVMDAMSYNKLNTFHWHISDAQSYPLVLNSLPNMSYYGAYTTDKVYTSTDIQDLIDYATVRGIRVVPEFDAPAHVGNGWQWGEDAGLGSLVTCLGKQPWTSYCSEPPCGQFNIANQNIYGVLETMYNEWISLFQPGIFHYGGDEINLNCWNTTQDIVNWMIQNGHNSLTADDYYTEWSNFQASVKALVDKANGNVSLPGIIWTSALTNADVVESSLDKEDYIIQVWTLKNDPVIGSLLDKGYNLIISNYDALYLDCGFGNWITDGHNWCSPFHSWKDVYDNSPLEIAVAQSPSSASQIVGGEAALWTEQSDASNIHSRLWPRGAALGERLWNDIEGQRWRDAAYRFLHNRQRMVRRGIPADAVQPEWCYQNSGECNL